MGEKKFSGSILEQGRMIAERESQINHLKGQLNAREDKIKNLEATIREHGTETEKLLLDSMRSVRSTKKSDTALAAKWHE